MLSKAESCYIENRKKTDDNKEKTKRLKDLNTCYTDLRKDLVAQFKDAPASTEKILNVLLPEEDSKKDSGNPTLSKPEIDSLKKFDKFTTYFSQYDKNRKNLYKDKAQATAIAYRTINDNLDKFLFNRQNWNCIREKLSKDKLETLQQELSDELQSLSIGDVINVFDLKTFNQCILQKGITAYYTILGGKSLENGKKIQGLNELINEYNQSVDKKNRLPRLVPLFKQIMGDASLSFVKPCFDSDNELWKAVNDYYSIELLGDKSEEESYLSQIAKLIEDLDYESAQGVFINSRKISSVSQHVFDDYGYIKRRFEEEWKNQKKNKKEEFKMPDACELSELLRIVGEKQQEILQGIKNVRIPYREKVTNEKTRREEYVTIYKDFPPEEAVAEIKKRFDKIGGLCNNTNNACAKIDIKDNSSPKNDLKDFLDALLEFCHAVFLFRAKSKNSEKLKEIALKPSEEFYKSYDNLAEKLRVMPSLYDKVRNYATRKPYSTKKYRVFFGEKDRCKGWAYSREKNNKSFIIRKYNNKGDNKWDYDYYLGIYTNQCEKSEYLNDDEGNLNYPSPDNDIPCYEKMIYAQIPGANKQLPKNFFSKEREKNNKIPEQVLNIYENKSYENNPKDLYQLIDYYKKCIPQYKRWKKYNFISLKEASAYQTIQEFANDVDQDGYRMWFERIAETKIRDMVQEGKLLLFRIYNKDFSEHSKGRENLHTMYWKALFSPENLENPLYKLNGSAELFFREATPTLKKDPTHKKGEKKVSKKTNKETGYFTQDIIKDKRFTEDSYQFHVPIKLNFRSGKATQAQFNDSCIEYIKQLPEDDIHFIGIDRGERHLIYLSLIDRHGNIVKQKSYNEIESKTMSADGSVLISKYNYHQALDHKEKERKEARVNWDSITAIKDLKSGFLSQVVSDIARMMVDYHAVVALEDLNFGFKRGRFKIEKQVYQKFEKALIDKLNYLVFKEKAPDEEGGLRHPLQLTAPFESFKKLGKQTGMLFYIPAAYTSKIDPTTGFVDQLKPHYEKEEQAQEFFNKFDSITYKESYFVFKVDYNKFGVSETWKICTHGGACRHIFNREKEESVPVDVTGKLENILKNKGIEYKEGQDLRPALAKGDKTLLETFIDGLRDVLRLRYEDANGNDVLISPVKNAQGIFFNSSTVTEKDKLPVDPDANGAYHIALKMLLLYERIRLQGKTELVIKNQDWFDYAYQRCAKHNK